MAIEFGSRKETFENYKVYETMLAGRPFKVEMGKMCGRTPKLDMERLSEIRKVVSVPLVLHGTSGVPDDAVRECVARGMSISMQNAPMISPVPS